MCFEKTGISPSSGISTHPPIRDSLKKCKKYIKKSFQNGVTQEEDPQQSNGFMTNSKKSKAQASSEKSH